jgi:hypothetical protein
MGIRAQKEVNARDSQFVPLMHSLFATDMYVFANKINKMN